MAYGVFGNKAILLSRVSTQGQVLQEGFSPQQNDLLAWAKEIGYSKFHQIDSAESGFIELDAREGWNRIFTFLEEHPDYKTIIATEINRLARDESVLMYVKEYLYKHKIQLIIKDLSFFLLNPDGEKSLSADLMFNIYASMARFEMDEKNSRKKRALTEYRKKGYSIGGKELFGYDRVVGEMGTKKKYNKNDAEAKEIETIFKWYAYGIEGDTRPMSVLRITQECIARGMSTYLHSKRNVGKCLKERAYTGIKTTKNKKKNPEYWNYKNEDAPKYIWAEQYDCIYPVIIEQPLFDTVQMMLKRRNSKTNKTDNEVFVDKSSKHTTILSKLIVCPYCSKYLTGEYRVKDGVCKHTYRCASSRGVINKCDYKTSHSMVLLDSVVWSYVKTYVKQIAQKKLTILANANKEETEAAILRLKEKVKGFDVRIEAEDIMFRRKVSTNPSKENLELAMKEYDNRVNEIKRERDSFEREIAKKEKLLLELQRQEASLRQVQDIDISSIERNKEEMYKYTHLILTYVRPVYTTKQFTVLGLNLYKDLEAFSINDKKTKVKNRLLESWSYLFVDKRNTNNIKIKLIEGKVEWSEDIDRLCPLGGINCDWSDPKTLLSVEDVFSIDWNNTDIIKRASKVLRCKENAFSVTDIPYNRLSFYDEDVKA